MMSNNSSTGFDTTGQVAPPGSSPYVRATLWEEEGTVLFHVDVDGTMIYRREDNHMINASRLLDATNLSQEEKNEILDAEKLKHVVMEAPVDDLVGTWISFDRALDLANKQGITQNLYPLFVHNLGAMLYPHKALLDPSTSLHVVSPALAKSATKKTRL